MFRHARRAGALAVAVAASAALVTGCSAATDLAPEASLAPAPVASSTVLTDTIDVSTAQTLLERLPVKGRAPKTGYSREQFGKAWSDDVTVAGGHNSCDTRNDILNRDLVNKTFKPGTKDCVVLTGILNDPYTGKRIEFKRGQNTSTAVQIDHIVSATVAEADEECPGQCLRGMPLALVAMPH
ncbi:hypothetical protein [Prescottella agglutinans]|uniref:HNH endonuclease n=1 Tax=Prescottella agglutinans TaxID=1644129 RepID=A0ABT6MK55_9NOCA|nr:hypothetical protein [Prescottella agglutinans]MDH6284264.1 hypothetical protein [Prescottella agglutinans]